MRLDKWLWAARFFKTRGLAQKDIELGRVKVNGDKAKSSKTIQIGDVIEMRRNSLPYKVTVEKLNLQRRPAIEAKEMYREDEEVIKQRETLKLQMSLNSNMYSSPYKEGRPTKKDRRSIEKLKRNFN
ncbi:RNA-binding protein [Neisseriaceae bacterium PsAf]|nr:RNA-binding protein [Neisseriaceae bacterium PsAf]MCV2503014.1 RNA-binding S4 domain-containing protein [Neisseriaceae bacterium]